MTPIVAAARIGALAVTAFALSGCVTPPTYGPIGSADNQYGYRDRQNPDGSHTILVVAAGAAQAHEFWDRRAEEICGSASYDKNIFRAEIPVVTTTGYASNGYSGGSYVQDVYGAFTMEGLLRCTDASAPSGTDAAPEAAPSPEAETAPATP